MANVIGIAATPSGNGYWVVQATGKVYRLRDGPGLHHHRHHIAGHRHRRDAHRRRLLAGHQKGGVYPYGNATKQGTGTLPAIHITPNLPVIGIVPTAATTGYWLLGQDGGIFAFGTAPFDGSLPACTSP